MQYSSFSLVPAPISTSPLGLEYFFTYIHGFPTISNMGIWRYEASFLKHPQDMIPILHIVKCNILMRQVKWCIAHSKILWTSRYIREKLIFKNDKRWQYISFSLALAPVLLDLLCFFLFIHICMYLSISVILRIIVRKHKADF